MRRVIDHRPARPGDPQPGALIHLAHDMRRLRRRVLPVPDGEDILIDLPATTTLAAGERLILEDGGTVEIVALPEALLEVRGRDAAHLVTLAWHLGNRHLPAQLEADRILVVRDHVIADMLAGLGARVREIEAPFFPEHGAYHSHAHGSENHALVYRR